MAEHDDGACDGCEDGGDKIYEDSIEVSVGRFIIRTPQGSRKATGRELIFLRAPLGNKTIAHFNGLQDSDLNDLQRALNEYLHMLGLS